MRTKNGKRIGPVPITLVAVFALAAFLSAGLLLTTGAQPAAAQDADCTVPAGTPAAATCNAVGDTATVKFEGPATGDDDLIRQILIEDPSGSVRAYREGTAYNAATGFTEGGTTVTPKRYRYQQITISAPKLNNQGVRETQSETIMVSGDVLIWADPGDGTFAGVTIEITDAPSKQRSIATGSALLDITFLGIPSVGEDSDCDDNTDVDDTIETGEDITLADCGESGGVADDGDDSNNVDLPESRSKLYVRKDTSGAVDATVLGGGSKEVELSGATESMATIYAVVEDKNGEALDGTEVIFTFESVPSGITRAIPAEDEAEIDDTATGLPTEITVADDAVAMYTVRGLPTGDNSYRVTVKVTADGVNLGTVILARPGKADMLDAGIYDYENCVNTGSNMASMADDTFDMDMEDCAMSDPARFPRKGMFALSATTTDARGTKISDADWMIKDIARSDVLTVGKVRANASMDPYLLVVKEDAAYGMHTVTVTNGEVGDDLLTEDLMFYVAGPPVKYTVNPMGTHHTTSSRVTFTVSALDENDGVPHLVKDDPATTDKDETNNKVKIDAIYGTLRGVDENNYLVLDLDTGMKTFTYTLPRDADSGEEFEVTVGEGDMAQTVTVVYGSATTTEPSDDLTAPTGVIPSKFRNSITVSWTPNSAQNAVQIKVALFNEDGRNLEADVVAFHAANDPGIHTFNNVAPGTYQVVVASFRPGEPHQLSDLHEVVIP